MPIIILHLITITWLLVQACLVHTYLVVTFGYLFLTTSKIAV